MKSMMETSLKSTTQSLSKINKYTQQYVDNKDCLKGKEHHNFYKK